MKKIIVLLLIMVAMVVSGCSSMEGEGYIIPGYSFADKKTDVAVIDITGAGSEANKDTIANMCMMELMRRGFTPIERARIKTVLKEQRFQASDISSKEDVARAGKILNVSYALMVSIPEYGSRVELTVKMVDVETGKVVWLASSEGDTGKGLATFTGAAVGAAVGAASAKDHNRVGAAVIGGIAGGVIGHELSPSDKKILRRAVAEAFSHELPEIGAF